MTDKASEISIQSGISVEYEGIKPSDSLFEIDGNKLKSTLVELGYPSDIGVPIVITDKQGFSPSVLASYDSVGKKVIIRQVALLEQFRGIYGDMLESIGELPESEINESNIEKLLKPELMNLLNPLAWPYLLVKEPRPKLFAGNFNRLEDYMQRAKEGTLEPGKPLNEQRERAKKHLTRLIKRGVERIGSWAVAHEYEHRNKRSQKAAVIFGLGLAPIVIGNSIMAAVGEHALAQGMSAPTVMNAFIPGLIAAMSLGLYGVTKGRSMDENESYKAGNKYADRIIDSIQIKPDVFQRDVVDFVDQNY